MVPRIHNKGASFKGAAAYLLHDKEAATSERVAWTDTRNMATNDPDVGWRVMAATAMDQDRLKAEAGIKATGRKSKKSVLHFTLSWHEEEAADLTPEEMRRAAYGALRSLGAGKHQAMIIAHSDESHPHVHVLVNRVSAEDGRMLSSSKEQLKISRWAQEYEQERGKVYCKNRVFNNAARDRGEYVRGEKSQARNVYEAEAPANDNSAKAKAIKDELKRKAADIAARARRTKERHKREWDQLEHRHRQRSTAIRENSKRQGTIARDEVRKRYRRSWETLFHEDRSERAQFNLREEKLFGKVENAVRSIDFRALVSGGDRRKAVREAFQAFGDSGARLEALKRDQNRRAADLLKRQRNAEAQAAGKVSAQHDQKLAEQRSLFERKRSALLMTQNLETAKIRAEWKTHSADRSRAWVSLPRQTLSPDEAVRRDRAIELVRSFHKKYGAAPEREAGHERERDD